MKFPWSKDKNVIVYNKEMQQADSYLGSVINAIKTMSRKLSGGGLFGISPDGKRDFNTLFGYGTSLSYADYLGMYKRGGIASVIVNLPAKLCWRDMPEIKVNGEKVLEEELLILKRMKFFKTMERADILNRIGSFSVLLIGVADGEDLKNPVGEAKKNSFGSMYFNAYNYDGIEIIQTDNNPASTRFGLPELYQLQVIDVDGSKRKQVQIISHIVHHSRIVHMAEGALDSTIEGTSALEAPWNALTDKDKVRGSSAEAYYRNSRQKLALETVQGTKLTPDPDLKQNVEDFQNNLDDTLRLNNMTAKMLQPSMVSPRDSFNICIEETAGTSRIPVRFLTTMTGGTVTGSEDKASLNAMIKDRQDQECSIYLLDALAIMAEAGIIDLPENAEVVWNVQSSLTEKEASESMKNKADAFKSVADGLTVVGGDELLAGSVFKAVGLDGIEVDNIDIGDNDDKIDKDIN